MLVQFTLADDNVFKAVRDRMFGFREFLTCLAEFFRHFLLQLLPCRLPFTLVYPHIPVGIKLLFLLGIPGDFPYSFLNLPVDFLIKALRSPGSAQHVNGFLLHDVILFISHVTFNAGIPQGQVGIGAPGVNDDTAGLVVDEKRDLGLDIKFLYPVA